MKERLKNARRRYEDFMERRGFYWLCALCCLTIGAAALWTARQAAPPVIQPPLAPAMDSEDETLAQARRATPLPAPTAAPPVFQPPVAGKVLRPFSMSAPVYFPHTGHWQAHPGCDYAASPGEAVKAAAAGTVTACGEGSVTIRHDQGYESRYLGLISTPYVLVGDPVKAGQTIGHAGEGPLWEQGEESHLHLEILHEGTPVDPRTLFE